MDRRRRQPWLVAALALALIFVTGFTVVRTNALGMGERFERLTARIENFVDPPPDRSTIPTVVITPEPSPSTTPLPQRPSEPPTPSPTPLVREPVDIAVADDHEAVFTSQISEKDCAVAGTQMVLTILGLGEATNEFQTEIHDRIGEWESLDDSLNGGWGPAAVALALADYGEPGYEIRAYENYADALRDSAIAIIETGQAGRHVPVVGRAHLGHDRLPSRCRSRPSSTMPRSPAPTSSTRGTRASRRIWGASDPPGNFEDLAELERNWPAFQGPPGYEQIGPGWTRPEGAYPDRDGRFVVPASRPTPATIC